MNIDQRLISRLEHLARLELTQEERQNLEKDLNNILQMVETLQQVNTDGVAPLSQVNEPGDEPVWREDQVQQPITREEALKNAPEQDGAYFKVPKVIDL